MIFEMTFGAIDRRSSSSSFSPRSGAVYNPKLVSMLHEDHAELLDIMDQLGAVADDSVHTIAPTLEFFGRSFASHLYLEQVHFYEYLDQLLVGHPLVREEARVVWLEMKDVAESISLFIHKWTEVPPTKETLRQFMEHLERTNKTLIGRVKLEESTLYTLYTETL